MSLMRIHLTLGRDPDFPHGSNDRGYEFIAPLREDGHINAEEWQKHRMKCYVRRFWAGEDEELGHLVHTRGRQWAFHYDVEGDVDDDEVGFKFDNHLFRQGEYVSIREHDGEMRTFKVASVEPLQD